MRQKLRLLLHAVAVNGTDLSRSLRQAGFRRENVSSNAPRLLFYAVNGVGMGHLTRLLGLARQVRHLRPDAEILFLTSSEAAHLLYREGFASIKTPSHSLAEEKILHYPAIQLLNHHAAQATILAFDPHCLVVDCFPSGLQDELLPSLCTSLKKVFVFRAQREDATRQNEFQKAVSLYDLVLVPHNRESEKLHLPAGVKSLWTGPMVAYDTHEMLSREDARAALDLPANGYIGLLTLGGGGEKELLNARCQMEEALREVGNFWMWVEACGPLSRQTKNGAHPWRALHEIHPLMLYLNAFDGAISAAGYNTVQEMQRATLPTILWPFPRLLDDQTARAQALANENRALVIGEGAHENRVAELKNALAELMDDQKRVALREAMQNAVEAQQPNGATVGAEAILRLLSS